MANEEQTCGPGLAEQALLPSIFAELMASVAEILEVHTRALDLTDENARVEHSAYERLVDQHRATADHLRATGDALAGCRELPPARHDEKVVASTEAVTAFARFVEAQRQLLVLLEKRLPPDEQMLAAMRGAST